MPKKARILLVEDTPSLAELYVEYMGGEPWRVDLADTGAKALRLIAENSYDALLLDLVLPDMDGLDILRGLSQVSGAPTCLVMTAHGSVKTAVEAMRAGAHDFLVKPFNHERLLVSMRNALEHRRLRRIVRTYGEVERRAMGRIVGSSLAMQAVYRIIDAAAPSKATVFITGESGTGKELCAEAVHQGSPRAEGPFIALNCAAIPKDLMESEIFGHIKGAFTGATADREGAASQANGGTLFLDEVCEMEPALQTKLLRFVQTGTFQKVGSGRTETVDIRFLCATNRDPLAEVRAGRFREDLYYRLHVIPLALPPLRERDDDVLVIARHLLDAFSAEEGKAFTRFSPQAEARILAHDWPGNVRELQNVVRHAVVLNNGDVLEADMLPPPLDRAEAEATVMTLDSLFPCPEPTPQPPRTQGDIRPLEEVERAAIEEAVELCDGNVPKAAALLGVSASTIYRKRTAWEEKDGEGG